MDAALTPQQQAWKTYKEERRASERAARQLRKEQAEQLGLAIRNARLEGKVLRPKKRTPLRKYMKIPGGRAASRNMQFRRPATGNRRPHHQKMQEV